MSKVLGPAQTVRLLEEFRQAVRDVAARADKLTEDYRLRAARERVRRQAQGTEQTSQADAALAGEERRFEEAKAAAQVRFENRKRWLNKAYQSSREQGLSQIENQTGGRKYELQKKMLQAEREREKALADAAAKRRDFQAAAEAEQHNLASREAVARTVYKGYGSLGNAFLAAYHDPQPDLAPDENRQLENLRQLIQEADRDLGQLRRNVFYRLLSLFPFWVCVAVGAGAALPWVHTFRTPEQGYIAGASTAAGVIILVLALRWLALAMVRPSTRRINEALSRARRIYDVCMQKSEETYQAELKRISDAYANTADVVEQELKRSITRGGELRVSCRMETDQRMVRATALQARLHKYFSARLEREHAERLQNLRATAEAEALSFKQAGEETERTLAAAYESERQALEVEWKARLEPIYAQLAQHNAMVEQLFPPWHPQIGQTWRPPAHFYEGARFGQLDTDLGRLCDPTPKDKKLTLPGPSELAVALALSFPQQGSLLFETKESGHDEAVASLNDIVLRLLASSPAGRLAFTIFDPVGLGQNFAGVMHLADYEDQLITNRIWTQSGQIEQRLADLNEHMEKVIQMYLRNEYADIVQYNEQAGVIAEKYHFLVIADFPVNFTETATKRLLSIAASGAKCGVYMLIHWDRRQAAPPDFIPDELRKNCFCLTAGNRGFVLTGSNLPGVELSLEMPPAPDIATEFIHRIGRLSKDSSRVEVPFSQVTPNEAEIWSEDTTAELRVPIGRTGATKLQYLEIGKGTRQHGLIAGKTGSGKSTLFHVLITNLSLWCSPEQVEFYLVDFKKGVEFKCYATNRLPHARVVAIESDREFGLSVLQRVDEELKRRGDLFRKLGVQDIPGYKRAGGKESIPRSLLLIDEFQEFFVEDDKIAQTASLLLDRIVRQGRAFGIHVLLGSQTLGGAYTVARTTLGQMVVRIALQCNEADAYLIMDENNPAPRLLSRPGEGIYNDAAGALEGNSPFQVVWLSDQERDAALRKVRDRADAANRAYGAPIVFEGNAPADIAENLLLSSLLQSATVSRTLSPRIWLGAPNSIKGPTEVVLHRQSGNNLIVIGQNEEAVLAMFGSGLIALAAQHPVGSARFILLDGTAPGTSQRAYFEKIVAALPHQVTVAKPNDLAEIMSGLAQELSARAESPNPDEAPPCFLIINGLQKYSRLRYEEEFSFGSGEAETTANPGAILNKLVTEGTRLGLHVIASCDTYNNANRFLSRKAFSEFEMRVLFQMSASDSANLIDSPRASNLGMHRALFFNQQEGYLETFRPYALPSDQWIASSAAALSRLLTAAPLVS